jgi:AAA ATPase domain/Bacterial transcriptional activator domain
VAISLKAATTNGSATSASGCARYLDALDRLAALHEASGDLAGAIRVAEPLLRRDPLREETSRLLMRLHDARGDRARALQVYHVCVATLEQELGVEPSAATQAAYQALLSRAGDAASAGRLGGSPFVGRAPELARLATLWRGAEEGRAHFVLVTGEPGVGKTRLVEEFRAWRQQRGGSTATARSYRAEGALAFGPVIEWLSAEPLKARRGRLDLPRRRELSRLLPELHTDADEPAVRSAPEDDRRQALFDAAARAILAAREPLLLVADDLHWCDGDTLQFLHYLLRVASEARLLVVATARREEIDRWGTVNELLAGLYALERCTEIHLDRLTRAETALLAERFAGRPFGAADADRLYQETEGNPLFVVETLRAGWRGGDDAAGRLSPRAQTAIEDRLAAVSGPARELVDVAATIGREFTTDVLAQASGTDADTLVRGLDNLWRRRIVREQGVDAYDFSHDKIREVAYLVLSPARRRHLHLRVAQALERLHVDDLESISGQLAAHYERAGLADLAVDWYERAAGAAQQMHANAEAVRLLDHALDRLRAGPETPARRRRELDLLTALPPALGLVEGWASPRLATVQRQALDLAGALGVEPAPPLLRSAAVASLSRRDYEAAARLGKRLQTRAERDADDVLRVEADYVLGIAAFWRGELAAARRHFARAVECYRPEHRREHLLRYGLDPKVICLSRLANTFWFLGRAETAARLRGEALALADVVEHPPSRAIALVFAGALALDMRDADGVRAYTAMLTSDAGARATRPTQLSGEAFRGYVDVLDGRAADGLARIERALDDARDADHAPGMRAHLARLLVEACAAAGDVRSGLAAANRALAAGDENRLWEAETRRQRAEFLAALGAPANDVAAELERARDVARRQGALPLELRATVSLLRHRLGRGDAAGAERARQRLAAVVAAIPEGRDAPDVATALALLAHD